MNLGYVKLGQVWLEAWLGLVKLGWVLLHEVSFNQKLPKVTVTIEQGNMMFNSLSQRAEMGLECETCPI